MFRLRKVLIMIKTQKQLTRSLTYFGIETSDGLFCLSKDPVGKAERASPKELQEDIKMYVPDSNDSNFNKLNSINNLYKLFSSQKVHSYRSFFCSDSTFTRTIALKNMGCNNNFNELVDLGSFHQIEFQWNGKNHFLKDSFLDDGTKEFFISQIDQHHPIFDSKESSVVYSDYNQVLSALDIIHKNDALLDISEYVELVEEGTFQKDHDLEHPFIVVEGLDGTGKSTLSKNLSNYLNARAMSTPPPSIAPIRKKFDHLPEIYRRAYYAFSNYLAAQEVLEITKKQSVVMDRFWHSTTAYAIANEVGCGIQEYLPPKGHTIYTWPKDLLSPSAVIFLSTSEKDRDSRVKEREDMTAEEKQLSVNRKFRARIMETYKRIGHINWVEIDTSGTKEETLAKTVASLEQNGIC